MQQTIKKRIILQLQRKGFKLIRALKGNRGEGENRKATTQFGLKKDRLKSDPFANMRGAGVTLFTIVHPKD